MSTAANWIWSKFQIRFMKNNSIKKKSTIFWKIFFPPKAPSGPDPFEKHWFYLGFEACIVLFIRSKQTSKNVNKLSKETYGASQIGVRINVGSRNIILFGKTFDLMDKSNNGLEFLISFTYKGKQTEKCKQKSKQTQLLNVKNKTSPKVALNWAWASISPWISSRVWTMNMSTKSSRVPSNQLLKGWKIKMIIF